LSRLFCVGVFFVQFIITCGFFIIASGRESKMVSRKHLDILGGISWAMTAGWWLYSAFYIY
jgi:hypothetical protein